MNTPSPYRAGYEPEARNLKLPDLEVSGGVTREVPVLGDSSLALQRREPLREGRYTFEAVLIEGFLREGVWRRRVHTRETVVSFGYNEEHARAKAAKDTLRRYPWLSNDYSMLYLNGITVSRYLLGQRRYKTVNYSQVLVGTAAR